VARTLEGIGRISFSIYLLHFAVIETLGAHGWLLRPFASAAADALLTTALVALPLVLALSAFTYATVERPFMALRRRYVEG
jgi:peptidoglycan/LPS O-acetylase OafA/YrhL